MWITTVMVKTSGCCLAVQIMIYISVCLVTRDEICSYSVKENVTCYHLKGILLRTLRRTHFITLYPMLLVHIYAFVISYFMLMHIESSEEITLLEFNEEEEDQQETPQAGALGEEEQTLEDLPECLDHRPTSFLKGKPWSILSLPCFTKYYLSPLGLMH